MLILANEPIWRLQNYYRYPKLQAAAVAVGTATPTRRMALTHTHVCAARHDEQADNVEETFIQSSTLYLFVGATKALRGRACPAIIR